MTPSTRKIHRWLAVLGLLVLAACASTPEPRAELEAADRAIMAAREVRAEQYAQEPLRRARIRLEAAREAMSQRKYAQAAELAAQAEADADLAAAQSRLLAWRQDVQDKTQRNAELRRSLDQGGRR